MVRRTSTSGEQSLWTDIDSSTAPKPRPWVRLRPSINSGLGLSGVEGLRSPSLANSFDFAHDPSNDPEPVEGRSASNHNAPAKLRRVSAVRCNRLLGAMLFAHGCCLEHVWSKTFLRYLDRLSINFESQVFSAGRFRRDEGGTAAAERVEDNLPR